MVKLILLRHHSQLKMEKMLKLSVVCQMLVNRSQTHRFRDKCAKKLLVLFSVFQCYMGMSVKCLLTGSLEIFDFSRV